MLKTLEKFIETNTNGLFLLDSPTGFGKTTAVLDIIGQFLRGEKFQDVKRMFFVTNLKTNLPDTTLLSTLTEKEQEQCLRLKAYDEAVIENWQHVSIDKEEITNSKEYRELNTDIDILFDLMRDVKEQDKKGIRNTKRQKSIESFRNKITTVTEKNFRDFLKKTYFNGKSVIEKKEFIKNNDWFRALYPICEMEKKKVVFMTTAKFFSPINVFYRMPFYLYNDDILNGSVVFVDEFDSTKETILGQIIDNCLKVNIDIISLFTNIHYVLQGLNFPSKLLKMTNLPSKDPDLLESEEAPHYYTSQEVLDLNRSLFQEIYEKHKFDLLLKSFDFKVKKAFLFDDGNNITVYNDNSKRYLNVAADRTDNHLKLTADTTFSADKSFNYLINDVLRCINYFANGVKFLAQNYYITVNTTKRGFEYKYSKDEALMTILSAFNLNGDHRDYLQTILTDGRFKISGKETISRKGFKFTEVEDSNYHDLQSVAHQFHFETTPENLMILIAERARLIGISATASLRTVIGNFDLEYMEESLGDHYIHIDKEDKNRIRESFLESQSIYEKVDIDVTLIDDLQCFSDIKKCKILLKKIFPQAVPEKYLLLADDPDVNAYYYLMNIKLAYLYKQVATTKIRSFIVFLNRLPKKQDKHLNTDFLDQLFQDVASANNFEKINFFILKSDNFDSTMHTVYDELARGNKCFVISTYKTVGSGKNIQYPIPDAVRDEMILVDERRLEKDFDAIYLTTPTNLTQRLTFNSDNKYRDLAKYLYQQQSLCLADKITNGQYRQNVISGFKRTFFSDQFAGYYNKNSDLYCHSAQLAIQAIGRICRCRNKNKKIHIYSDTELLERVQNVRPLFEDRILNAEFSAYLHTDIKTQRSTSVQDYASLNKKAYYTIRNNAYTVRSSPLKVSEWIKLRDYVLQNPTADAVLDKYSDLYFHFDSKQNGFSYTMDNRYNITSILLNTRVDMRQVSMQESNLPTMLSIPCIETLFRENKYAMSWKNCRYVMSPSLYTQVYKGALGEVVGKCILDHETGWELEEIEDHSLYELFDFKLKNLYLDFKHWNHFRTDPNEQIAKIKRKLRRVNGEKAVIINLIQRGNHIVNETIDDDIITIPYLINPNTNDIDLTMIQKIEELILC